jgi:predicted RNase H-like nuclease (RuvC/YqgF family)
MRHPKEVTMEVWKQMSVEEKKDYFNKHSKHRTLKYDQAHREQKAAYARKRYQLLKETYKQVHGAGPKPLEVQ